MAWLWKVVGMHLCGLWAEVRWKVIVGGVGSEVVVIGGRNHHGFWYKAGV